MGDFNYEYYYCGGCSDLAEIGRKNIRLNNENLALKNEQTRLQNELAMVRKAYAELAEKKSALEAGNEKLVSILHDRDAVINFLWDKVIR